MPIDISESFDKSIYEVVYEFKKYNIQTSY